MSKEVGEIRLGRGTWYRQRDRRGRRDVLGGRLESVPTGRRPGRAPWRRGSRWSAEPSKRDVVLRLLRGEYAGVRCPVRRAWRSTRLEAWRERAMAGLELGLKDRHGVARGGGARRGDSVQVIGELSMEIELLRERAYPGRGAAPPLWRCGGSRR